MGSIQVNFKSEIDEVRALANKAIDAAAIADRKAYDAQTTADEALKLARDNAETLGVVGKGTVDGVVSVLETLGLVKAGK